MNDNFSKKLVTNEKSLESLNIKLYGLSSTLESRLNFNKMLKTQLAQLTTTEIR